MSKLDNRAVIDGWINQPRFADHFFTRIHRDDGDVVMVLCRCPSWPDGLDYSGVAFFWVKEAEVQTRPESFFLPNLPPPKLTHLGDPNCFALMEERLEILHKFFKQNRMGM